GEVPNILDEGLDLTDGDDAPHREDAARHGHGHIAQVAHKVHHRHHQAGEELAFPGGFVELVVGFAELRQHGVLPVESLDHVVPGVDFLHLAVDDAQVFLLGAEVFLAELYHQRDQQHAHRQDQQGDHRHHRADGEHHDQHADHGG